MPESFHDRQWRQKHDVAAPDFATRNEQLIELLRAQLAALPTPLAFIKPAAGWDPWDLDPQTMTSADIAANGWNITLTFPPHTVLTRAGEVRWMDHTYAVSSYVPGVNPNWCPADGTYYSSLIGGRLMLQIPGQTDISIWRSTANPPSIYTAGLGGGSGAYNQRHMYIANGAPGTAGVTTVAVWEAGRENSAVGGTLNGVHTVYGSAAQHFAIECFASQAGHATGRFVRVSNRQLFSSANSGSINPLVDTTHGNGIYANTSRCGVRLRSGSTANPIADDKHLPVPLELFYIRRQPHRANAFW